MVTKFFRKVVRNVGYIIKTGRTSDGRPVTIEETNDGRYALISPGCRTKYSASRFYIEEEFNKQVPDDSHHRDDGSNTGLFESWF